MRALVIPATQAAPLFGVALRGLGAARAGACFAVAPFFGAPVAPGTPHCHSHRREAVTHAHPHYPDAHHRHVH